MYKKLNRIISYQVLECGGVLWIWVFRTGGSTISFQQGRRLQLLSSLILSPGADEFNLNQGIAPSRKVKRGNDDFTVYLIITRQNTTDFGLPGKLLNRVSIDKIGMHKLERKRNHAMPDTMYAPDPDLMICPPRI